MCKNQILPTRTIRITIIIHQDGWVYESFVFPHGCPYGSYLWELHAPRRCTVPLRAWFAAVRLLWKGMLYQQAYVVVYFEIIDDEICRHPEVSKRCVRLSHSLYDLLTTLLDRHSVSTKQ